jgi:hypothetical protein
MEKAGRCVGARFRPTRKALAVRHSHICRTGLHYKNLGVQRCLCADGDFALGLAPASGETQVSENTHS